MAAGVDTANVLVRARGVERLESVVCFGFGGASPKRSRSTWGPTDLHSTSPSSALAHRIHLVCCTHTDIWKK